jgi:hypothetical protein
MAANPKVMMSGRSREPYHVYHADAHILSVELEHPIKVASQEYGRVVLEHTRREGLITQSVGETNIEGLISFKRGHSRVAGAHIDQKTDIFGQDHAGWFTLATAVLEGYNVEDIITADRVVAQLSTQHPMTHDREHPISHVPRVNFLGTRFDNLRVGGYPIDVELDLTICGAKPDAERTYLEDGSFLDRVHRQLDRVAETRDLPASLEKKYGAEIAYIDDLKKRAKENRKADSRNQAGAHGGPKGYPKLRCSLVKNVSLPVEIPGVRTFGNAIFVQDFGTVHLAELEVGITNDHSDFPDRQGDAPAAYPHDSNYFTLNMVNIRLGCPGSGQASAASARGNGQSYP